MYEEGWGQREKPMKKPSDRKKRGLFKEQKEKQLSSKAGEAFQEMWQERKTVSRSCFLLFCFPSNKKKLLK